MRVVADTNIVVSGLLWRGNPRRVLDAAREAAIELFTSAILLTELEDATAGTNLVLIEPELSSLFPDTESVNRALRLLAETAASATGKTRRRGKAQTKRLKRSA